MNEREKKLAMMVGMCFVAVALMFSWHQFVAEPIERLDAQIVQAQNQLGSLNDEQNEAFEAQEALSRQAAKSFGEDPDEAAAEAGAMLTRKISEVGLSDDRFTRRPLGTRRIRGAVEIGWQIQGRGELERIIDLLYLLENAPYLQRLENIVIAPDSRDEEEVTVNFRLITLVLEAPPGERSEPLPTVELADAGRNLYDRIAARNMLRPYVQREPEPEPEPEPKPEPEPEPEPSGPSPGQLRVVSLSEWRGRTEIVVRDEREEQTQTYAPGDELAEGVVVMVDYRPLAMPDDPGIRSQSRVIVKVEDEYWAIERGHTLADKRRLTQDELPPDLSEIAAELSQQAESP